MKYTGLLRFFLSAALLLCLIVPLTVTAAEAPHIVSLAREKGAVGTEVTIIGAGFGASQGPSSVTFNGSVGTPTSWSDTKIVVPVPKGATSGLVVVIANGLSSNGLVFVVQS